MDGLKNLDPVAYVRFASVYRNFREEKDFVQFVDPNATTLSYFTITHPTEGFVPVKFFLFFARLIASLIK